MSKTVTAVFDRYEDAEAAVRELKASGVPDADISIVARNERGHFDPPSDTAADAGTGAGIGAAVGGAGGLLAGLGLIAIPGIGPVVAAGWLVAAAAGAVAGAVAGGATGGIIGAMTESGISEDDAHVYAETVRRGGTLVTARVPDGRAAAANAILQRTRSIDIGARGEAYRKAGWKRFDEKAEAFTHEQMRRERELYHHPV